GASAGALVLAALPHAARIAASPIDARRAGPRRREIPVDSIALLLSSCRSRAGARRADDGRDVQSVPRAVSSRSGPVLDALRRRRRSALREGRADERREAREPAAAALGGEVVDEA